MKKFAILFGIVFLIVFQTLSQKENTIYEAKINKENSEIVIVSDYKDKIDIIKKDRGAVYFDIKDAFLVDNFKMPYDGEYSVVTQQIGKKVRFYLKGEDIGNFKAAFVADKGFKPADSSVLALICAIIGFMTYIALKSYSATIKLREKTSASPIKTAGNLNRRLYEIDNKKGTRVVLNNSTIPINSDVVDFQYAKDRKNIKIAI